MKMVQNLNDKATAEANKTTNGNKNSNNSAMLLTEENGQKRVHQSSVQLQGHQVCTHVQLHQDTGQAEEHFEEENKCHGK